MRGEVQVESLDVGPDGWTIYQLSIPSIKYDTIRVGKYNNAGDYRVEILRNNGWAHLLAGRINERQDSIEWQGEAVQRASKVLFS